MRAAVYPGSFDPITNGHLDVIKRSAGLFDLLIVAVAKNSGKKPTFSVEERIDMIRRVTHHIPNVVVDNFEGLLVEYAASKNTSVIIKGLRAVSDFEYEFQMALMNKKLKPGIETVFIMTDHKYSYLSSSMVREVASLGGSIEGLVPDEIIADIENKYK
ncbi:MAG TPA: pantetheine-phosphate adenylyltransferase [Candidatus Atribacteria bacterium]|nr:pantetheine-phosphate adenylyltransferase [Candidatus Atribacteria bacterium]HPT77806.1 pantetheine-phosphate adenylyltransferase [Candidatus Atribacteria bacterium]